ncbi:hypothetical protein Tco_0325106, partial [Tanacetum coccineum]
MAAISNVPQLVDKKGGNYSIVAPRLELGIFNKWKKRMLCYFTGMEPYYIQCIKDGPFKPKMVECADKRKSQWTPDEKRVVNQDQRLKIIIISCLPDDMMESVISCETAKATWTGLKTLLNELTNDGVTLSKHKINVDFVNSLPEKWLSFSQGHRNSNHTQTLDLADIYGRFIYEDNLISTRLAETKKALITTPSDSPILTAFFSNNIVQDFQEKSNDEVDERSSKEYLRDLELEFHERALLENLKFQKDYKAEYKKMKPKIALLEASPSTSQSPKPFQSKNKGLVAEMFNWDEKEVSDDEKMTQVKVERNNPDRKLPNFNTGRNLVPKSQPVNECLQITKAPTNPASSKESGSEPQTPLPPLKNLKGASSE